MENKEKVRFKVGDIVVAYEHAWPYGVPDELKGWYTVVSVDDRNNVIVHSKEGQERKMSHWMIDKNYIVTTILKDL